MQRTALVVRDRLCDPVSQADRVVNDRDLIQGTLAGRTQDFETLVERYQGMLFAFAYRYTHDADMADDVVQATFMQAYTHLARFRGASSFKTWLHQIALNQCRSALRTRAAQRAVPIDDVSEAALPHARNEQPRANAANLDRLMARLPPRQRSVVALRVQSDLPFKEIARIEGISENAAKVNYHHAISRLKQWLTSEPS
jgi:RNA polymerase sigma-70 factor (ECF subfamily)